MPRKYGTPGPRLIYPQMVQSAQIRELAKNPLHLLIWYSLFHGVDDQGRMEARVSVIQTSCLGHLPEDSIKPRVVQEALHRMQEITDDDGVPLIYLYPSDETVVLQMTGWWDYQGGMRHAWPSRWPAKPGWTDEFRGHGKRAFNELVREKQEAISGPDGDPVGGQQGPGGPAGTITRTIVSNETTGPRPWDLFQAYLDEMGITHDDFPGKRRQLAHAKTMLAEGFTVEDVREATKALRDDPFWSTKGIDMATILGQWGKIKANRLAKPKRKAHTPGWETPQPKPLDAAPTPLASR